MTPVKCFLFIRFTDTDPINQTNINKKKQKRRHNFITLRHSDQFMRSMSLNAFAAANRTMDAEAAAIGVITMQMQQTNRMNLVDRLDFNVTSCY